METITSTLPVLGSSATTAPLRPCSPSIAACCALVLSVVRIESPSPRLLSSESTAPISSVRRPVSGSLRNCSSPERPSFVNE